MICNAESTLKLIFLLLLPSPSERETVNSFTFPPLGTMRIKPLHKNRIYNPVFIYLKMKGRILNMLVDLLSGGEPRRLETCPQGRPPS